MRGESRSRRWRRTVPLDLTFRRRDHRRLVDHPLVSIGEGAKSTSEHSRTSDERHVKSPGSRSDGRPIFGPRRSTDHVRDRRGRAPLAASSGRSALILGRAVQYRNRSDRRRSSARRTTSRTCDLHVEVARSPRRTAEAREARVPCRAQVRGVFGSRVRRRS